jgi:hypothetical protein
MNYTNYYNEIRSDIAKDFGLEAGGYAPIPKPALSIVQAMRLNAKYPSGEFDTRPSDKAVLIAKRYASLKKVWSK